MWQQYFNLFKFNFEDYNFKLILYSFLIFTIRFMRKVRKAIEVYDPVNKTKLIDWINVVNNLQWISPIILLWTLYETFTLMKIILLVYYFMINTILFLFVEKKRKHISVKVDFYRNISSIIMKSIESIYFIFFLPLSTYQNTNLKGIFWTTLYITLCSQKN